MCDEHCLNKKIKKIALRTLWIYACMICYRFKKYLPPISSSNRMLRLPKIYKNLKLYDIKEKAKASLTTSGVFFAFSIAVIVAFIGPNETSQKMSLALKGNLLIKSLLIFLNMAVSYSIIWQERFISAVSTERFKEKKRYRRYIALIIFCVLSILLFIVAPIKSPLGLIDQDIFKDALSLSGLFLIILSAFFLLCSLEFYDSASGWRGEKAMHFHLASIASHSSLIGFCLALVGISQLLCIIHFWLGSITTCVTLFILVTMTEIERSLWDHS